MKSYPLTQKSFFWALQALSRVFSKPFSIELAKQQICGPYSLATLETAAERLEMKCTFRKISVETLQQGALPLVLLFNSSFDEIQQQFGATLLLQVKEGQGFLINEASATHYTISISDILKQCSPIGLSIVPKSQENPEEDILNSGSKKNAFGFSWFFPELKKHKRLWQEILLASLVIQLIALATPLFTQTIIDKVLVHRTDSTLIVLILGMLIFSVFSSILSWLRQYLVLHTGNRIDAKLGGAVFEHLFKIPLTYFQHRPTGVISARLHGIETIREFVSSAAVTIILDFPFLIIFISIMFFYNSILTFIVLGILTIIAILSFLSAPIFQQRLQRQFQLGARNQAFITEYISGMETVKSLQLEPQLNSIYSTNFSSYLEAGFLTKQLMNSYTTVANFLDQIMTLSILGAGAYFVMNSSEFTIGMLVAFQMFSSRLSQPVLRLVGLWQQFQQARLSVARLADLMDAPAEPYSIVPSRRGHRSGEVEIEGLSFRYSSHLPFIYQNLNINVAPGNCVAIMGPSGCGKSTLAKLMQGFYIPNAGTIRIDGVDIYRLSANELRSNFGVVPQETTLFSGTIYNNLQMSNPSASFEQIEAACRMAEIHKVIEQLPNGYQTEIGERGVGLSGGQKQRIAIARALLKRPSILVFDEATSALDEHTSEQFARTINSLKGKVTIIFITHRIPKSLLLDAVFLLDSKKVPADAIPISKRALGAENEYRKFY